MIKALVMAAVLMVSGALWAQEPVQEPAGCGSKPVGTVCKLTYPNGNVIQIVAGGTIWAKVTTPAGERIGVQLNSQGATGIFSTRIIANRYTDVVNGPQSDVTEIQGDCRTQTYQIMGGVSYSGQDGSGSPVDVLDLSGTDVTIRRVLPDTNVSIAFKMLCK